MTKPYNGGRILVTNDDGYAAEGIAVLREVAAEFGEAVVVAPEQNRSGASSALTLRGEVPVRRAAENEFIVSGTPADCVHLALTANFTGAPPALIVSGINDGANLGDDTIYSGTVAAAIEGALFDIPAIAFSVAAQPVRHFATAAEAARILLARFFAAPPPAPVLLNVNVPDVPLADFRGLCAARAGRRAYADPPQKSNGGNGADVFQYTTGGAGAAKDGGEGTDFYAVQTNRAAVTPLTVDRTAHGKLEETARWLSQ